MKEIDARGIASCIETAIGEASFRDVFEDHGLEVVYLRGSNRIQFRPVDPRTGDPRKGSSFTLIVEEDSGDVKLRTVKILRFPINFGRKIALVKAIRERTGLNLRLAKALAELPRPIDVKCVSKRDAAHLRNFLEEVEISFE